MCHPDLGIGGAERLVVDMAAELAARGHLVRVFTTHHDKERCFKETVEGSFSVSVYGSFLPRHIFHRFHALCAYIRCIYMALMMCLFGPPLDVVIVDQVSAVIPFLKAISTAKVLFYCHFPDLLLAQRGSRLRRVYRAPIDWLEEATTGMADEVLVNSRFTASVFSSTFRNLTRRGLRPRVLYPAVNLDAFSLPDSPPPPIPGLPENTPFFLSINRFERKKNIALAVRSYALFLQKRQLSRVPDSPPQAKLVIAGGYDERVAENREYFEELQEMVAREQLSDHVVFLPSFSDHQKQRLLSSCLCVLYTPENEHFGIVPLEAMAASRPVVACSSGGPTESILEGESGFLCEPHADSFAQAMDRLAGDGGQLAEQMGRTARAHVERTFSRSAFGDRLENLLLGLAGGRG